MRSQKTPGWWADTRNLTRMFLGIRSIATRFAEVLVDEGGQDLVEYALVVAMIGLAATAGMSTISTRIVQVFSVVGTKIAAATT